jgi:ATP-dependent DNA ligase
VIRGDVALRAELLRLVEPMLARSGGIPRGTGWLFEPKLDGFRCLCCTHGRRLVCSRRGWDMTPLLPEQLCSQRYIAANHPFDQ